MSRQIQIRRGTTIEHASFTGAIGEITMDTDKKTIFVHDGEIVGGIQMARKDEIPAQITIPENYDFVVESGGNNSAWYRKYKSGWMEQGGSFVTGATSSVITMQKAFSDKAYTLVLTPSGNDSDTGGWADLQAVVCGAASTYTYGKNESFFRISSTNGIGVNWMAAGY